MYENVERFDMKKPPVRCRWYLKPIAWAISLPGLIKHKPQITKIGMEGVKPPYLLLGNHNAFYDMNVSTAATFPKFGNYVVAIDGFIGREWLLRSIGCICKRKFTNDISLIRNLTTVIKKGGIPAIYPEARYSLCGTTSAIPRSLGQVIRKFGIPVVLLMCHGHHINHPFWNTRHERGVKPTEAEMKLLFTAEQTQSLDADEINARIVENLQYDDWKWQRERGIRVTCPDRAECLEKILYQCPHCRAEYRMRSAGTVLTCGACGKEWEMDELGQLAAIDGETEFSHVPDWYEWERANVRAEVEAGTYTSGELPVTVESLPNAKKFIPLGKGTLVHDLSGFRVRVTDAEGAEHTMTIEAPSQYAVHVEYNYLFKHGDCVDLNTASDTWYVYPEGAPFSVTKMALATEEIYYDYWRKQGREFPKGTA